MLLCATTHEEIRQLFAMARMVGLETLEWIVEGKRCWAVLRGLHGWHWLVDERVDL